MRTYLKNSNWSANQPNKQTNKQHTLEDRTWRYMQRTTKGKNLSCAHFKQNTFLVSKTYNRKKVVLNENLQMQSQNVMVR